MPGPRPESSTALVANDVAAILRHDLISPINLIVGYSDLLLSDATDLAPLSRESALRSIRGHGYALLKLIDRALLSDQPERTVADIEELSRSLSGPSSVLIRECDALLEMFTAANGAGESLDDLKKIRSAGVRMIELAEALHSAQFLDMERDQAARFD